MADFQGLALYDGPIGMNAAGQIVAGTIMSPENIPHYYKELVSDPAGHKSILQVITVGVDSQGNQPPEPPAQFRARTYHAATRAPGQAATQSVAVELISQGLALLKR